MIRAARAIGAGDGSRLSLWTAADPRPQGSPRRLRPPPPIELGEKIPVYALRPFRPVLAFLDRTEFPELTPKQASLDLRGDRLAALWRRLPERTRRMVVDEYARLIARLAQERRGRVK